MSNFTLDDIRSAAQAKYGDTTIQYGPGDDDKATLVNPLRLTKDKRAALTGIQGRINENPELDQVELLEEAVRLAAGRPLEAEALIEAIGGDLTVLVEVFASYTESTQAGEASASRD